MADLSCTGYSAPGRRGGLAEYCDERICLSVCLSVSIYPALSKSDLHQYESGVLWWPCLSVCVCLSAIISLELHVRSSPNFVCMLSTAVARSGLLWGGRYDTLCTAGFSVISLVFLTMLFVLIITFWLCVYVGLCEWDFFTLDPCE